MDIIEAALRASYLAGKDKLPFVQKAIAKLDLLKFFLLVSWEIRAVDNKKYIILSERLEEIGKMLGGWNKQLIR